MKASTFEKGIKRTDVAALQRSGLHPYRRVDDVVASIYGCRYKTRLRGDCATGASAYTATTDFLGSTAIAMGAAIFTGSHARASVTHGALLRRNTGLPLIAA